MTKRPARNSPVRRRRRSAREAVKPDALVRELDRLARAVGFAVRTERGRFRSAPCRLEERRVVVLNRLHPPEVNAAVLADALADVPLDGLFVPPALRRALDEARARRAASAPGSDAAMDGAMDAGTV